MKKFIASAGLVSVGAASLQAAYAPGLTTMETSKPWSIAATVRGFYDDNYLNQHGTAARDSVGFELSPAAKWNMPLEQTYISLSALYSLKYYFDKNRAEHMAEIAAKIDHRLSPNHKIGLEDSLVYSSEPTINDPTTVTTFQRQEAIRNRALLSYAGQFTEVLGAEASYQNTWYEYLNNPDLEAILNRVEHAFDLRGTWRVQEHLTALLGYTYGIVDYTSADINFNGNDRDSQSHTIYVGAEHAFSAQLNGTLRVGGTYTTYDNLPGSELSPFVDLRGTYTYLPGSYVQLGFTHARNATDVRGVGNAITKDQESSTLFASITHRITPRLSGTFLGQFQQAAYNGGGLDDKVDYYVLASLRLDYQINNNFSAEAGYNFDRLDSDLAGRSFTRNRIYAGVRAVF